MLRTITCFLLLLNFSCLALAQPLRIQASDLLEGTLDSVFEGTQSEVKLAYSGSMHIQSLLQSGEVDLAIVALPAERKLEIAGWQQLPLAYEVATVYVNASNPLESIGMAELEQIFGARATTRISNWGQLGLSGSWSSRGITANTYSAPKSVAMELFKTYVLSGDRLRPEIVQHNRLDNAVNILLEDDSAIMIMSQLVEREGVRALHIGQSRNTPAYAPTPDNILYGDYVLRLPFLLMIREDAPKEVRQLAAQLYGDAAYLALSEAGFVSLPASERKDRAMELRLR